MTCDSLPNLRSLAAVLTFTLTVTDTLGLASLPDTVVVTVNEFYFWYWPLISRNGK